jgi:hypothetical protein
LLGQLVHNATTPAILHDLSALRSNKIIPHTLHVERVMYEYIIAFVLQKKQVRVTQAVIFIGGI